MSCGGSGGGNASAISYSLSGSMTSGSTGLPGVTMTLSGAGAATATTDASGNYTFSGLANGIYTITPSKTGYTFTPASSLQTVSGANISGVNFTAVTAAPTFSISGTVTSGSTGLAGVTMTLSGAGTALVTTDASGNYTFAGLGNGSYTITPSKAGYTFTPTSSQQAVSGANISGVNITATLPQPAQIVSCPTNGFTLVTIQDFSFTSPTVTINAGSVVKWMNIGPSVHTVTSGTSPTANGIFNSGNINVTPLAAVCVQFFTPGSYPYFSTLDLAMTGVVTVQ
jgi:inhibitor of cysteine peptidase